MNYYTYTLKENTDEASEAVAKDPKTFQPNRSHSDDIQEN